ncbi:MAG: response regulator transcription factor [Myxococcales bacterium]|nr:response regulator transcription factor [Myxococcales bacterium]
MKIRLLLCDDQAIARQGLKALLSVAPDIEVIGSVENGMEALRFLEDHEVELVLLDLKMPVMNGPQTTRELVARYPKLRILILTTYEDDEWLFDAIRSGAHGYLLKDTPPAQLIEAIRGCVDGKTHIDPSIAGKLLQQIVQRPAIEQAPSERFAELNEREREVLVFLARGFSNQEIAKSIHLSEGTVRNYVSSLFAKLGVNDRTKAALLALRYGLVSLDEISDTVSGNPN